MLLHSEISLPFELGVNQTATLGTEWNQQRMKDPSSTTQAASNGAVPHRQHRPQSLCPAEIFSLFAEDNMELTDSTMLTPALRFDHHSIVGNNWSRRLTCHRGWAMTSR